MRNPSQYWAVIPARGGSKGVPRKNLKPLADHPLVAYSIGSALASGVFARVLVSTDDPEIAEAARAHGAEVPGLRPAELASDTAPLGEVILKEIDRWVSASGHTPAGYAVLLPTFPFRTPQMLSHAADLLHKHTIVSTFRPVSYPTEGWWQRHNGHFEPVRGYGRPMRGIRPTGHINAFRYFPPDARWTVDPRRARALLDEWVRTGEMEPPQSPVGRIMIEDPVQMLDIDHPDDWAAAEWILRKGWYAPSLQAVAP